MEKAKVYYSDFRAKPGLNLLDKLKRLIKTAKMGDIDFEGKFVAIKIHFGEPGNLSFLRPNYAKAVADVVKEMGGRPFLTDCNTLYVGRRKDALDHIEAAYENGFTPYSTGCQILIADGLKGTDETIVPIDLEYVKEAKIGHALMDADIVISLTHFKGHEATGFGGALKNIGMGGGSRAGKMEMHSAGKPRVHSEKCRSCGACSRICAHSAISFDENKKAKIDHNKCVGCGRCIGACNFNAVRPVNDETNDILNAKIAEYTYAIIKDRANFHISLVMDVSPNCDCHSENDAPIIPDVGMFASFDPVALDQACADMANQQSVFSNSHLGDQIKKEIKAEDHFCVSHPDTNWKTCLEHAEKIGLGTRDYELIKV